jgi:hypothetical protein
MIRVCYVLFASVNSLVLVPVATVEENRGGTRTPVEFPTGTIDLDGTCSVLFGGCVPYGREDVPVVARTMVDGQQTANLDYFLLDGRMLVFR